MAIKIIGAGFGRTGTFSVKAALEELGFDKCYHMSELIANPAHIQHWENATNGESVDWDALFTGYQAAIDFPTFRFYRELMDTYPDAKVLLTVRDPDRWYESAYQTIYQAQPSTKQKIFMAFRLPFSASMRCLMRVFRLSKTQWQGMFQDRFEDKAYAIDIYNQHNAQVQQTVPAERLLTYQVTEGWEPLCRFLDVPVPEGKPFPHLNDREVFQQRLRRNPST